MDFVRHRWHNKMPGPWLTGNMNPKPDDWEKAFPVQQVDFQALNSPPGELWL